MTMDEMKFHLIGYFKLSGDATTAEDYIANLMVKANEGILTKGAPSGKGAKVINWNLDKNGIKVEIQSDRYVRVHDALLRLRKALTALLGEHHIGIRGIEIEKFTIKMPSEEPLKKNIPFVKDMRYEKGEILLTLDVDEQQIKNRVPDRIVSLIEEKVESRKYGKKEHWELLWQSEERIYKFKEDPTKELTKRKWVKHGSGRGQWIFGPQMARVFRAFGEIIDEEIIRPLGYHEMIFPKMVTWDVWKRSGHAKGIYPEIYYVCPPKTRDPEYWEEVIDYYKVTQEVPLDIIKEKIDKPIGGMCYAQCPPFWVFLQGETLPDDIFPICIYDRSGPSHRYESGGIHGIERVDEFHRIELIWIGKQEQVVEHSKKLQERYQHLFDEILDIQYRKAWVTPWFMAQEGLTGLAETREVGTIDYEAYMPYKNDWLEFQNLSVNGSKYPDGFNVKLQSGEELWSGCSGIGLERWGAAFLAQKGLDVESWPTQVRKKVGELPEVFKFL
ncbi:MAG: serine--tRNA ligase [Methanocellales archaeon]|nr:serine--tRNA ligase [Methanocellales archaeon]